MKHGTDNTTKLPFPTTILLKSYVGKTKTPLVCFTTHIVKMTEQGIFNSLHPIRSSICKTTNRVRDCFSALLVVFYILQSPLLLTILILVFWPPKKVFTSH